MMKPNNALSRKLLTLLLTGVLAFSSHSLLAQEEEDENSEETLEEVLANGGFSLEELYALLQDYFEDEEFDEDFESCEEDDEECLAEFDDEFESCEEGDEECSEEFGDDFEFCEEGDEECFADFEEDGLEEQCEFDETMFVMDEDEFDEEFSDDDMFEDEEFELCEAGDEECLAEMDEEFEFCEEGDEECFEQFEFEECSFGFDEEEFCEDGEECDDTGDFEMCEDDEDCDNFSGGESGVGFGFNNPNPAADNTVLPVTKLAADDASRFLTQASLGANYALITQVANQGHDAWLESQFNQPVGTTLPYATFLTNRLEAYDGNEDLIFEIQGIPESYFSYAWWTQAMTSPDVVRQRVATALSEIMVVSGRVEAIGEVPYAMASYYDMLLNNSFGNFRDLLRDVTLHPTMGIYLSHYQNAKADPSKGTFPDENYAREVMQLFSIGLFELNADGSQKLQNGQPIATYDNNDIREFAKVFTGLGNGGDEQFFEPGADADPDFTVPMAMYEQHHDTTEKRLLNGAVVPGGQSGMQDIDAAIDNLFNHPNVGPFIGKQLIQRLVTSNPSPQYVARVTAAFNGETGAPRGDMKAVIRAILLDPEAQTAPLVASTSQGKLREPFLRFVHLSRAFNIQSHDRTFNEGGEVYSDMISQNILQSPSVFNFFQPGYAPLGELTNAGLVAPEFQITSASSIIGVKNQMEFATSIYGPIETSDGSSFASLNLSDEITLASNTADLLDRLDTVLTFGTLTDSTRTAITSAIEPITDPETRVRTAIYLIMISPDYAAAI